MSSMVHSQSAMISLPRRVRASTGSNSYGGEMVNYSCRLPLSSCRRSTYDPSIRLQHGQRFDIPNNKPETYYCWQVLLQ